MARGDERVLKAGMRPRYGKASMLAGLKPVQQRSISAVFRAGIRSAANLSKSAIASVVLRRSKPTSSRVEPTKIRRRRDRSRNADPAAGVATKLTILSKNGRGQLSSTICPRIGFTGMRRSSRSAIGRDHVPVARTMRSASKSPNIRANRRHPLAGGLKIVDRDTAKSRRRVRRRPRSMPGNAADCGFASLRRRWLRRTNGIGHTRRPDSVRCRQDRRRATI